MFVLLFIAGLAFGSFLNVLTLRYDPEGKFSFKTAGGRSRCLACGKSLRWYELVPLVSFFIQWGRCRSCKKIISWQYPIVELLSAILFVAVPKFFLAHPFLFTDVPLVQDGLIYYFSAFWIVVFLMLLGAFIIDLRHRVIPNGLNLAIFIAGLAWTGVGYLLNFGGTFSQGSFLGQFAPLFSFSENFLINHLLAGLVAAIFFLLIVMISRGRGMGMGDVKLMIGLGILFGWPDIVAVALLSFILGTFAAVPLLILKKRRMSDKVPFGPFIVTAAAIIFFFGVGIFDRYFAIIQELSM